MVILKKIFKTIVYIFAVIGFVLTVGYFAVRFGFTNTAGIIDRQRETFLQSGNTEMTGSVGLANSQKNPPFWTTLPEWGTLEIAIIKDKAIIYQAATIAGVTPRLLVTQLVVEQLRLFYSERESFKKFFEPLKILGSQTKFSWGVMGIKEDTAIQIENHLKDKNSPFYLGVSYENLLNFSSTTASVKQERFVRMTDQHAHYYSYLYAGLYLKEVMTQWKNAGFPISDKPDILTTLYNIGFNNSKPKANPQSGGAEINLYGHKYSFGSLGKEFYDSNELIDEFPR